MVQLPPQVERLIIFNEHKDLTAAAFFAPREKVLLFDRWSDVLQALTQGHAGRAKVAAYTTSDIQYCAS